MAAADTLRRITQQDQLIIDASGNMVGVKNPNANGADLRTDIAAFTSGTIGGVAVAQIAAAATAVSVTPETYGAVGNGTADDTTALQSFLTANRVARLTPGNTYKITAPLVIPSSTVLIGYGATISLGSGSNCRMLRTSADVAGSGRNVNIAILGGTWARGNSGGVNNETHSIFLRRVDGLEVRDVSVTSSAGKYAIAIGNCTRVVMDAIFLDTVSDGIHLSGPITGCDISNIHGATGDDMVAMTTNDFVSYADTTGDIVDVNIRSVHANGATRAVLLGCTANNLKRISIRDVTQAGSGNGVAIGDGGTAGGVVDDILIDGVRAVTTGSRALRLTHSGIGRINARGLVSDSATVECATEGAGCVVSSLTVIGASSISGNVLSMNAASVALGSVRLESVTFPAAGGPLFLAQGSITDLSVARVRGSSQIWASVGTSANIASMTLDGVIATVASGYNFIDVQGATITTLRISNSAITGSSTTDGSVVKATASAVLGSVFIQNTSHSGGRVVLFTDATVTGAIKLYTVNVSASACNRLIEAASPVTWNFSNVQTASSVNQPIRIYGGGSLVARGMGFSGYVSASGCVIRATAEVIQVVSPDLQCDLSILAKNNGDLAFNTNTGLACGAGPATSNGTNWKNLYSGLTY